MQFSAPKALTLSFALITLSGCTDPAAYAEACTSYGFTPGTQAHAGCMMSRADAQAQKNQRTSAALNGMTMSGAQQGTYSPRTPSSGASALTVNATSLCPMRNGWGNLRTSTVSGMNRICYYS